MRRCMDVYYIKSKKDLKVVVSDVDGNLSKSTTNGRLRGMYNIHLIYFNYKLLLLTHFHFFNLLGVHVMDIGLKCYNSHYIHLLLKTIKIGDHETLDNYDIDIFKHHSL